MVKKIIAVLLLVGFLSYALWEGLSPNEASDNSNLSEYKDLNIKKGDSARQASGQAYGLEPKIQHLRLHFQIRTEKLFNYRTLKEKSYFKFLGHMVSAVSKRNARYASIL